MLSSKIKYFVLAIIIVAVDLYTKHLAAIHLIFAEPVKITDFFNLTLLYNNGAAFSFLSNSQTSWQVVMFSIISLIAAIFISYLIIKQPRTARFNLFSFSLVLGGAVGNFYDRAFRGSVVDFLDFHIGNHHWPAFNIADTAVSCGVVLLILSSFFGKKIRF